VLRSLCPRRDRPRASTRWRRVRPLPTGSRRSGRDRSPTWTVRGRCSGNLWTSPSARPVGSRRSTPVAGIISFDEETIRHRAQLSASLALNALLSGDDFVRWTRARRSSGSGSRRMRGAAPPRTSPRRARPVASASTPGRPLAAPGRGAVHDCVRACKAAKQAPASRELPHDADLRDRAARAVRGPRPAWSCGRMIDESGGSSRRHLLVNDVLVCVRAGRSGRFAAALRFRPAQAAASRFPR